MDLDGFSSLDFGPYIFLYSVNIFQILLLSSFFRLDSRLEPLAFYSLIPRADHATPLLFQLKKKKDTNPISPLHLSDTNQSTHVEQSRH